jgi:hypothetical protein
MWSWSSFQKFLEDGAFFNQNGFKPTWFVNVVQFWSLTQAVLIPLGQTLLGLVVLHLATLFFSYLHKRWHRLARVGVLPANVVEIPFTRSAGCAEPQTLRLRIEDNDSATFSRTAGTAQLHENSKRPTTKMTTFSRLSRSQPSTSLLLRIRALFSDLRKRCQQCRPSWLYRLLQVCVVLHGFLVFRRLALLNEPREFFRTTSMIPAPLCPFSELENLTEKEVLFVQNELQRYISTIQEPVWLDAQREGESGLRRHRLVLYRASCDGLGNRLSGLLSAFYYAYMSNRAFLVDWEGCATVVSGTLEDLVDPPFPWNVRALLDRLGGNQRPMFGEKSDLYIHSVLPEFQRIFGTANVRLVSTAYCRPCPERRPVTDLEHLLCEDFKRDATPVFDFYGTHWTGAAIQHNPYFRNDSCKTFGSDVFGMLARAILRPNAAVQKIAAPIMNEMLQADLVVALQIRRRDSYGISAVMEEVMWRCAEQITVMRWRDQKKVSSSSATFESNRTSENKMASQQTATSPNLLIFVAADNEDSRKRIMSANDPQRSGMHVVHLQSPLTKTEVVGMQYAFAEIYLLSKADEIIISPYSSFGSVAHGWSSRTPWISLRNGKCMKTLSTMPCDVYWFGMQRLSCFRDWMMSSEMVNMESCYG